MALVLSWMAFIAAVTAVGFFIAARQIDTILTELDELREAIKELKRNGLLR